MSKWNDSKSQLSEGSLTAFGIPVSTRHSKAYEMAEMLNFCRKAAEAGLEDSVSSIFYDSGACLCQFELKDVEPFGGLDQALLAIAEQTIGQFEWNGTIYHGITLEAEEETPF